MKWSLEYYIRLCLAVLHLLISLIAIVGFGFAIIVLISTDSVKNIQYTNQEDKVTHILNNDNRVLWSIALLLFCIIWYIIQLVTIGLLLRFLFCRKYEVISEKVLYHDRQMASDRHSSSSRRAKRRGKTSDRHSSSSRRAKRRGKTGSARNSGDGRRRKSTSSASSQLLHPSKGEKSSSSRSKIPLEEMKLERETSDDLKNSSRSVSITSLPLIMSNSEQIVSAAGEPEPSLIVKKEFQDDSDPKTDEAGGEQKGDTDRNAIRQSYDFTMDKEFYSDLEDDYSSNTTTALSQPRNVVQRQRKQRIKLTKCLPPCSEEQYTINEKKVYIHVLPGCQCDRI